MLDEAVGGRFYERYHDGGEHSIGHVTAWEPPTRVAFTWQATNWVAPTEVIVTGRQSPWYKTLSTWPIRSGCGASLSSGTTGGARVAYSQDALAPERIAAIAALALRYQPRGTFVMPDFSQARAFWYQWMMYVDAGAEAIRRDAVAFAREQWNTWSPPGWFDDLEFAATAEAFRNLDWTVITLNAYRGRFLDVEPRDHRYDELRSQLGVVERI